LDEVILKNLSEIELGVPRPFWQRYLLVIGVDSLIVALGALLFRNLSQISNLYFWSSIFLFIIAVIPIFTEAGTSAKATGKALREGQKVGNLLKEKQGDFDKGAQITYLYGLSGFTALLLSILTLPLG
jgi:hypothetical protein